MNIESFKSKKFIETTKEQEKILSELRDSSKLKKFIETVRSIAGRDVTEMFSLEDIDLVAHELGLDGVIYLEKRDDRRHVNVLLGLNRDGVNLYDPFSAFKVKPYDEIQFGMYCQPVGTFRDEFQAYEQEQGLVKSGNDWTKFGKRGRLLIDFLNGHKRFRSMYADSTLTRNNLPVLQDNRSYLDCAPISLFIMSVYNSAYSKT